MTEPIQLTGQPCRPPVSDEYPGPWRLPILNYEGVNYFLDMRLKQFREVRNPHSFVDFDSDVGMRMCAGIIVLACPYCGQGHIEPESIETRFLRCQRCKGALAIPSWN